ncbi:hypothetical protein J2Y66_001009 [Paenarthrobacter nitroguajacolicus]|nr:hypothetical protein [Paenarthrobacter nitroguajacolicus]
MGWKPNITTTATGLANTGLDNTGLDQGRTA